MKENKTRYLIIRNPIINYLKLYHEDNDKAHARKKKKNK